MLTLKRTDGSVVSQTDVYATSIKPHKVVCRAWVRLDGDPLDPAGWTEFGVIAATARAAWHGNPWHVTLQAEAPVIYRRVTVDNADGTQTEEVRQWDGGPDVDVWGMWVRVQQEVSVPGNTPIVVPWGVYRVNRVQTRRNVFTITGEDALGAMRDVNDLRWSDLRLTKGSSLSSRVGALCGRANTARWGGALLSWAGTPPGTANQTVIYQGHALAVAVAMLSKVGRTVVADLDWSRGMYRSLLQPSGTAAPVRDVRAGVDLVEWTITEDRAGVTNRVDVAWTKKTSLVTQTMLTPVEVTDGDMAVAGRFGVQSVTQQATDATTETAAKTVGKAYISRSLEEAATISLTSSPLYGVEIGDVIVMHDAHGNSGRGTVREMTVDLTQASRWDVKVVPVNKEIRGWGKARSTVLSTTWAQWVTVNSPTVDETCKTLSGWTIAWGCALKDTPKENITVTAQSSGFTFATAEGWTANSAGKAQAKISITPPTSDDILVRVSVDSDAGPWKECPTGRRTTVTSGVRTVAGAFRVTVEVKNATPGSVLKLGELVVELPRV